jgi:predicted anti-sigma-YlaC factor YlaD
MDCVQCRKIINGMFKNLSPSNADLARASIDLHLLECKECRLYLKESYERFVEMYERKKKEGGK